MKSSIVVIVKNVLGCSNLSYFYILQSTGSALTATFWGALTSTRFACILLASALSPTAMLCLSVAICSCATWLLSAFASSSEVALWIGSVMVSVGTASVIPSGKTRFLIQYISVIKGNILTLIFCLL